MLVLSRKRGKTILFPELGIEIMVIDIHGDKVRIGINAPRQITVLRGELAPHQREQGKTTDGTENTDGLRFHSGS